MAKILLINPPYFGNIYSNSKFRVVMSQGTMPLSLCCIAAPLLRAGHDVSICDMNIGDSFDWRVQADRYDYIGITSTTPIINIVYDIIDSLCRANVNSRFIVGGAHATACPKEVSQYADFVCVGEGDNYILSKVNPKVSSCSPKNLDDLPIPAYHLLDPPKYALPRLISRKNPVAYLQTSRGCFGKCSFCTKGVEGKKLRFKSPKRVVDEMEYVLSLGFREVQIVDDNFTADMDRVYHICDEIRIRKLNFPWYPRNGIRVDRCSYDLLKCMKDAGCYRVPFGVESGSQRIIDKIGKGITLKEVESALFSAKKAGLETEAYFMIGLPSETEDDLKKTLDFSRKINPDYAKVANTIPFPGTKLYNDMDKNGQMISKDWAKYHFAQSLREVYRHDVLSWDILDKYGNLFYKKFYFRPSKILQLIWLALRTGRFWSHVKTFLKTRWD
ncbi:MAG: B12-binding domain-containing radical SAM protein [Promethearchaeota archaeon]